MTLSVMVGCGVVACLAVLLLLVVVAIRSLRLTTNQHTTDGEGRPDRDDSWTH
jgi:hypothetical protein